jgi:hypothetical protein
MMKGFAMATEVTLSISGKDYDFEITGLQERFPIPGTLDEVSEWLRLNAVTSNYSRYFIPNGIVYLVEDENWKVYVDGDFVNKRVAFVFDDFRKGINNHVVFRVTYDSKAQYDVYKILWDMGGSSGAEWTQKVKEIWKQIPPPGYFEWVETEIFPGHKGQAYVWREGPPPGWTPPSKESLIEATNLELLPPTTQITNVNINIQGNLNGNMIVGDNNKIEH